MQGMLSLPCREHQLAADYAPPWTTHSMCGVGICHHEFAVIHFDLVRRDARKGGDDYVFHGSGGFEVTKKRTGFPMRQWDCLGVFTTRGGQRVSMCIPGKLAVSRFID